MILKTTLSMLAVATLTAGAIGAETLPNWTVTWTNDAHTVGLCSNDWNSFVLNVYRDAATAHGGFGLAIGIQSATKGSAVASVDGLEYLDLRGAIGGLDHEADPATNAVWKFSRFTATCFSPNDGTSLTPAQYITGLHSPGTLVANTTLDTFHIDSGSNPKNTKEIIIDEPNVTTSLGGWYLNSVGGLTNLIYRVPKATTWSAPTCHSAVNWTTDIGLWDVSGVKYIGSTTKSSTLGKFNGPFPGAVSKTKGTLRLPSLVHISAGCGENETAAFYGVAFREVELGLAGNLEYLANYSFKACNSLTNVVIGASPAGKTLTICTNAFWCTGLKTIYFNGEKPDIKGQPGCPSFGSLETPEGQITFYVRDIPSWSKVLAEADANGGFVSGATMGTANRQKVARFPGFFKTTVELQDPRFADIYHEVVTIERPGLVAGQGAWSADAVTLTAACSDPDDAATNPRRAKFLRWDGVPVALERENPLTYAPVKDAAVKAVFAHDWIMSDAAEPNRTMENGFWRICCYKLDAASHRLGIGKASDKTGKGTAWPLTKEERTGGGDLNLNGDVWQKVGDSWQKWTIVACGNLAPWTYEASGWKAPNVTKVKTEGEYDKLPTRVTFPETLLWWPGELQNYDSWDSPTDPWPVTELFAICPNATGTLSAFTVGAVSLLSRLVIRAPRLATLGSGNSSFGISWSHSKFTNTSFDEWDLTGVTTVNPNAFRCSTDFKATGTLHLPNVRVIGTNAFVSATAMTGLVAGTNGLVLTKIDDSACSKLSALTDLTLGTKALALGSTLGADSVFNLPKLKNLTLPGPALPSETVDAILGAVDASDTTKQTTIFASFLNGWDKLADAPTAAEAAVAPVTAQYGVYRKDSRKAWLVHTPSEYDPHGTILIFR